MSSSTDVGRDGFVLMEAVVALALIGLVAVALLATTAQQVRTADRAGVLLTARALAEERMAVLRSLTFEELTALPDSLVQGAFPSPFDAFTWRAESSPVKDEYDLFRVAVIVSSADDAFPLHTFVHQPRPLVETTTSTR